MAVARSTPDPHQRGPRRVRRLIAVLAAGAFALVAGLAVLLWASAHPRGRLFDPVAAMPPPLSADLAELHARRISTAATDAGDFWARRLPEDAAAAYRPPELVLFTRGSETACAGGAVSAGPFYCAASRTAAFDLVFAEGLARRLRREAELGNALVVARIAAVPALEALRRADPAAPAEPLLEADCLTGLWAAARRARIGEIPPGRYGRIMEIAGNTARDLAREGPGIAGPLDVLGAGNRPRRDAAFQAGLAAADPAGCLGPAN